MTELEKVQYRRNEIYIAEHYGINNQLEQLSEELIELLEAIDKVRANPCDETAKDMFGEIADVENMTYQIKYLMHAEETVPEIKLFKVDRQLGRIERGE